MHTMSTFNPSASTWQEPRQRGSFASLGLIALLHIIFFYALNSGLLHNAAHLVPEEVVSIFIASEIPHPSEKQAHIKSLPAVKTTLSLPTPVLDSPQQTSIEPIAIESAATPPSPADQTPIVVATSAPVRIQTISSGVEYIHAPRPEYPPMAKRMGEEGKVMLRILVNVRGQPEQVEVQRSSGSTRLDEAARQAVLLAVFKPHMEDGRAVAVYAVVPIGFYLNA